MSRLLAHPLRLIAAAVALAVLAWFVFKDKSPDVTAAEPPESSVENGRLTLAATQVDSLGLKTEAAEAADTLPIAGLPAEVAPPLHASARVAAPYGGIVTRVLRDEGDTVAAGDPLIRIQSRELLAAEADLARAGSEAIAAHQQARRNEALLKEGIIAASRKEESDARAAAAEAERQHAEGALAGLKIAKNGVPGEYELLAPIAGRVLRRMVVPGQTIAALEETYAVAAPGSLDLIFSIAIGSRSSVAPGMRVRLRDGSLGSVVAVGADTDRASQRLRVRARADNDKSLIAGQHVELTLLAPAPAGSIAVPGSALLTEGSSHVVYVADNSQYRAVRVEKLGGDSERAVIRGDIEPGAQVVVQGASSLKSLLAAE